MRVCLSEMISQLKIAVSVLVAGMAFAYPRLALSQSDAPQASIGASGDSLTADQTLAYINRQLAAYPDTWSHFACVSNPKATTVSLSGNRRFIFVDTFIKCDIRIHFQMDVLQLYAGEYHTRDGEIPSLDTGAFETEGGDHSEVRFMGHGGMTANGMPCPNYFDGETTWGPYVAIRLTAPEEVARRLGRALHHLVDGLKAESDSNIPKNDPFAQ